jgi:hypothetical protein
MIVHHSPHLLKREKTIGLHILELGGVKVGALQVLHLVLQVGAQLTTSA